MRGASIGLPIPRAPKLPLNHNEDFSDWQTVAAEVFGIHKSLFWAFFYNVIGMPVGSENSIRWIRDRRRIRT